MRTLAPLLISILALLGCKGSKTDDREPAPRSSDEAKNEKKKVSPETGDAPTKAIDPRIAAPMQPPPEQPQGLPADTGEHQGKHQWSQSLGGLTKDSGRAIAIADDGTVAIAGYLSTTAAVGAESFTATKSSDPKKPDEVDGYVSLFSADGKALWSRQLGGVGEQLISSVEFDKDKNVIVAGWFGEELSTAASALTTSGADDAFIVKFAADGRRLWAKRYGGIDVDGADDIAVDYDGNIYLTGVFRQTAEIGGQSLKSTGLADIFLLKLKPTGEPIYIKSFGSRYDDFGRSLATDSQGNLILYGEFSDKVAFGESELESSGNRDLFVAKFDPYGEPMWAKGMGSDLDEIGLSVATDPAGAVVITGSFEDVMSFGGDPLRAKGRGDVFVAKYDARGNHQWSKHFGGDDEDIGAAVACDGHGNIVIAGWFRRTIDFGGGGLKSAGKKDIFLTKLAPTGAHLWSHRFGGKESDIGRAVAANSESIALSGTFRYPIDVGGGELEYHHDKSGLIPYGDIVVARFSR